MNEATQKDGKKTGFWAAILESMRKTGGCCGGGGNCCGPTQPEVEKKRTEQKPTARNDGRME